MNEERRHDMSIRSSEVRIGSAARGDAGQPAVPPQPVSAQACPRRERGMVVAESEAVGSALVDVHLDGHTSRVERLEKHQGILDGHNGVVRTRYEEGWRR